MDKIVRDDALSIVKRVIKILGIKEEKDIIEFITENNLGNNAAYIEVVINGVTRFTALYGVFSTYAEAQEAIKELPVHIQKGKPWVRNFGILQGLLKQG